MCIRVEGREFRKADVMLIVRSSIEVHEAIKIKATPCRTFEKLDPLHWCHIYRKESCAVLLETPSLTSA